MTYQPATTYAPRRRRSPLPWILGAVTAVAMALVAAVTLGRGQAPDWRAPAAAAPVPIVEVTTPAPTQTPKISNFEATPKIVEKKCFGSAGCHVTLRVDLAYDGLLLDPADSWLVIYEVRGVEDGPLVGNLTLTGRDYTSQEEFVSTTSSKSKISIKVTDVRKG